MWSGPESFPTNTRHFPITAAICPSGGPAATATPVPPGACAPRGASAAPAEARVCATAARRCPRACSAPTRRRRARHRDRGPARGGRPAPRSSRAATCGRDLSRPRPDGARRGAGPLQALRRDEPVREGAVVGRERHPRSDGAGTRHAERVQEPQVLLDVVEPGGRRKLQRVRAARLAGALRRTPRARAPRPREPESAAERPFGYVVTDAANRSAAGGARDPRRARPSSGTGPVVERVGARDPRRRGR